MFLCANTEIGQLLKLPNLIIHFTEHHNHENERGISFIDFVISHYNNKEKHTDSDKHDEHQNLPFKTLNTNINIVLAFVNQPIFSVRKSITISLKNIVPFHEELYTSNVFACIWLPPKLF